MESIPEIRLAKLLKKRQFDAAEAFARKSNLSMELIYCSKAALLIEQLSPWAKSTANSVNVDTLINILNKIQNVQYVIECCSKALISDYIQMRRIYLYARQKIMQNIKVFIVCIVNRYNIQCFYIQFHCRCFIFFVDKKYR